MVESSFWIQVHLILEHDYKGIMNTSICDELQGRPPKKELSSGGWYPCSTGFPLFGSVQGTHLYQCTSWHCCERLCLASGRFFFLTLFKHVCSFNDGWFMSTPAHTMLYGSFWPKNGMTPMPHRPYSPDLAPSDFFVCLFPWIKRVLKGKYFAYGEEVKQKMAEALRGVKIDEFKNCFEQCKKYLSRCIASNEEYFEGAWSLNT